MNVYFIDHLRHIISVFCTDGNYIVWNWNTHKWDDKTAEERTRLKTLESIYYKSL